MAQDLERPGERAADRDTLSEGLQPRAETPFAAADRGAVFLRTDKRGRGQLFSPSLAITRLGRAWEADLRVEDDAVSRLHAQVSREDGQFFITDLGSKNGTFVDDCPIGVAPLHDGSVVRLGSRVTLRFSRVGEDERQALSYLHELGHYDPLTRVFNRRYLTQHMHTELAFAERHGSPLSIILIDIDCFKHVNDNYGHQAGDQVLERVSALIAEQIRTEDVVARYGGEEFMVVLRATKVRGAAALAERIRRVIAETPIVLPDARSVEVTISAGCAALDCVAKASPEALIGLADRRLYRAKELGRNQVIASGAASALPLPLAALSEHEDPPSAVHRLDRLTSAFESLPDGLRLIVGLRYQERCSFAEIAAIVDMSEADVRDCFQRAMQKLGEVAA